MSGCYPTLALVRVCVHVHMEDVVTSGRAQGLLQ